MRSIDEVLGGMVMDGGQINKAGAALVYLTPKRFVGSKDERREEMESGECGGLNTSVPLAVGKLEPCNEGDGPGDNTPLESEAEDI